MARQNLAGRAYDELKAAIFDFQLLPGERFSENELAARLGVSRTPVRVALFMLAREGYLDKIDAHHGWMVRPFDFKYFEDLYEVRVNLELIAIKRLCESAEGPAPALDAQRAIWLVPQAARKTDGVAVAALDEAFHSAIVAAAGNGELSRIHSDITERIRIVRRLDFIDPARIALTYVEHGKLLRAILARKEVQAAVLLRAHIDASKAELRRITIHKLGQARDAAARRQAAIAI